MNTVTIQRSNQHDTKSPLSDIQWITLRDVLEQQGVRLTIISHLFVLLHYKKPAVQWTFYYVSIGATHKAAAEKIGVSGRQIRKYLDSNLSDVRSFLRRPPEIPGVFLM